MAINKRVDSIRKGERLGALVNHSLKQYNFNFFDRNNQECFDNNLKKIDMFCDKQFEKVLINYDKDTSLLDRLYNRQSEIFDNKSEALNTIFKKIDDIIGKEL